MRRKILFLVTEDWYFLSHRLCIAAACRDRGWEVVVVTQVNDCRGVIEGEGLRVVHLPIRRGGMNLVSELITILRIIFIYLRERPDIVHHVALKPIIYGSFAAKLAGRPIIVNAVAGMGHLFTANRLSVRFVRILVHTLFRFFMRNRKAWLILQNSGDAELFTREGLCPKERLVLIRGSGVDTNQFRPSAEPQGRFVAVIVSRMLKEKGIEEAIEAVRELKSRKLDVLLKHAQSQGMAYSSKFWRC